jgi:hypothetical protein
MEHHPNSRKRATLDQLISLRSYTGFRYDSRERDARLRSPSHSRRPYFGGWRRGGLAAGASGRAGRARSRATPLGSPEPSPVRGLDSPTVARPAVANSYQPSSVDRRLIGRGRTVENRDYAPCARSSIPQVVASSSGGGQSIRSANSAAPSSMGLLSSTARHSPSRSASQSTERLSGSTISSSSTP